MAKLGLKIGRLMNKVGRYLLDVFKSIRIKINANVYLFLPINGAGLGHLTRSLAIACELKKQKPEARIVFFTTSVGAQIVYSYGFSCFCIPPAALIGQDVGSFGWNKVFRDSLDAVIRLHRPGTLVFDGTVPYLGLKRIIRKYRKVKYVWVKRGLNKSKSPKIDYGLRLFDRVLVPGELGVDCHVDGKVVAVAPIILCAEDGLMSRDHALEELGLSGNKKIVYVQLGSENLDQGCTISSRVVKILKERFDVDVVLGVSPISLSRRHRCGADVVLVDYPNTKYLNAIDISISAGGYNSIYESIYHNVPTLVIPNHMTGADDQLKRGELLESCTPGKVLPHFKEGEFCDLVSHLISVDTGESEFSHFENGARPAAKIILS